MFTSSHLSLTCSLGLIQAQRDTSDILWECLQQEPWEDFGFPLVILIHSSVPPGAGTGGKINSKN